MAGPISWHVWLGVIITIVPATLAVGARFIARRTARLGQLADDWTILAALITAWAMAADRFYELMNDGFGYHASDLHGVEVEELQKSFLAITLTYYITAVLTKTSILLLYNRLFGAYGKFKLAICIAEALVVVYFIVCVCLAVAGCRPVSYFWKKNQPGRCIAEMRFFRWNGIINLLMDILVWALPLPIVWNLDLKLKQKLTISGIFAVGAFACLASIFRLAQISQISHITDPTYDLVDSGVWSSVEQNIGIICACLPTLRPLLRSCCSKSRRIGSIPPIRPYHHRLGTLETPRETPERRARQHSRRAELSHEGHLCEADVESESIEALKSDDISRDGNASVSHESEQSADQAQQMELSLAMPPLVAEKQ